MYVFASPSAGSSPECYCQDLKFICEAIGEKTFQYTCHYYAGLNHSFHFMSTVLNKKWYMYIVYINECVCSNNM